MNLDSLGGVEWLEQFRYVSILSYQFADNASASGEYAKCHHAQDLTLILSGAES